MSDGIDIKEDEIVMTFRVELIVKKNGKVVLTYCNDDTQLYLDRFLGYAIAGTLKQYHGKVCGGHCAIVCNKERMSL